MPEWIPQMGAAGAVIVVVVYFLQALKEFGTSRDAERDKFLSTLEEKERAWTKERSNSQAALMAVISLANRMVDRCQAGVPFGDRVTQSDVLATGTRIEKGDQK